MKVRFDVSEGFGGGMRFEDQRAAFDLAVKMADQAESGTSFMKRLSWDQNGHITVSTVVVNADGSWRKIN